MTGTDDFVAHISANIYNLNWYVTTWIGIFFQIIIYLWNFQIDGELLLAPGFVAPLNSDFISYHTYIDENLPGESPYLYGLHPNAEIGVLTTLSEQLFKTVFEMQPRCSDGQSGSGLTREEKVIVILF